MMLMIVYPRIIRFVITNNMENDLFVNVLLIIMSLSQFRPNFYNLLLFRYQYAQNKWHRTMIKEEEIREIGKDNQKSYFISNINKKIC